jgi:glycosyltransferase involved in cell wall biosynthesis
MTIALMPLINRFVRGTPMENKQIRILHVIGGVMDYGGTEIFLMNYYRQIDKSRIQFDFLLTGLEQGVFDDEILSLGGRLFNVPSKKQHLIKNLFGTYRILKHNRSSIVHSHLDGMNGLILLLSLFAGNKRRISHSHNTQHLTTNKLKVLIHNGFRHLSRMVATDFMSASKDASMWLHGVKATSKRNIIIVNAIDYSKFSFDFDVRNDVRNECSVDSRYVLGHVGRFHFQKNHSFLLELVANLSKKDDSVLMMLVGDGETRIDIETKINELQIQNHVYLVGKTSDTSKYYNAFDMFLLPSIFEGLGIVAIEAQVNGLPVIASKGVPAEAKISKGMLYLDTHSTTSWEDEIIKKIEQFRFHEDELNNQRISNDVAKTHDILKATEVLMTKYTELHRKS